MKPNLYVTAILLLSCCFVSNALLWRNLFRKQISKFIIKNSTDNELFTEKGNAETREAKKQEPNIIGESNNKMVPSFGGNVYVELRNEEKLGQNSDQYIEGDIPINANTKRLRNRNDPKKKYSKIEGLKWPTNVIPYKFDDSLTNSKKDAIMSAFKDFQDASCLKFIIRTDEKDYLDFQKKFKGCYSDIGRQGGQQIVMIGGGCGYKGTVEHMIMHALGFPHENNRLDRDEAITILTDKIIKGHEKDFDKYSSKIVIDKTFPYDEASVTHVGYRFMGDTRFPNPMQQQTIDAKNYQGDKLGQRKGLSPVDAQKVSLAYCRAFSTTTTTTEPPPAVIPTTTTTRTPPTTTTTTLPPETTTTTTLPPETTTTTTLPPETTTTTTLPPETTTTTTLPPETTTTTTLPPETTTTTTLPPETTTTTTLPPETTTTTTLPPETTTTTTLAPETKDEPQDKDENNPPDDDDKPLGDNNKTPSDGNKQPGNDNKPPGDNNKPPSDDNKPPDDTNKTPGDDNKTPGDDNKSPGDNNKPPGDDNKTPGDDNKPPGDNNKPPGDDNKPPDDTNKTPGDDNKTQGDDNKQPDDDNKTPGDDNKSPSDDNKPPGDDNKTPGDDNKPPGDDNKLPGDDNTSPGDDNKPPGYDNNSGAAATTTTSEASTSPPPCSNCDQQQCGGYPCYPQDWSWSNQGAPQQCGCSTCDQYQQQQQQPQQQQQQQPQQNQQLVNATTDKKSCVDKIESGCESCKCVNVKPTQEHNSWKDNFLCVKSGKDMNPALEFSTKGPVQGKTCLKFFESEEDDKNYICTDQEAPFEFFWSDEGSERNDRNCMKIKEPQDWAWKTKFLCNKKQ